MKLSTKFQNHGLDYLSIALAIGLGFLLIRLSPDEAGFVILAITFGASFLITPVAAFVALLILSPARTLITTEWSVSLPLDIGQILLVVFGGFWITDSIRRKRPILWTVQSSVIMLLLMFIVVTGVTGFVAGSITAWLTEWIKWMVIAVMALYVLNQPDKKHWVVFTLVLSGFAQAVIGLYTFVGGSGADHLRISGRFFRAFGTFGQPNPFGGFMGLIAPLALMLTLAFLIAYWRRPTRWNMVMSLFYGTASLFMVSALFASWSRGAWLGFAASCAVMLAALPRKLWQNIVVLVGIAGIGVFAITSNLLPATITNRMQTAVQDLVVIADVRGVYITPENYAVIERLAHWQAAINMAQAHPVLGVGFGNYDHAYDTYRLLNWRMSLDHAHNYYLNVLAETGTIGLLTYLLLFAVIILTTWKTRLHPDTTSRCMAIGLLGTWVYLSTHSLTDNLYVNNVFIHIGVMIGVLAVLAREVSGTTKERQYGTNNN